MCMRPAAVVPCTITRPFTASPEEHRLWSWQIWNQVTLTHVTVNKLMNLAKYSLHMHKIRVIISTTTKGY